MSVDPGVPVWSMAGLDLAEVTRFAGRLGRALAAASSELDPITVGLVGELGAGKTTFVQALVAALPGGDEVRVTSPTYAIVQLYPTTPEVRHVDLYRLTSLEELEAIGFAEMMESAGLNLVEWARSIPGALPDERVEIELAARSADVRDIRVLGHGARIASLLREKVFPR